MNNFFQIFTSGEQLFKSDSEAQDFLLPTPKPQTTCENSPFLNKAQPYGFQLSISCQMS